MEWLVPPDGAAGYARLSCPRSRDDRLSRPISGRKCSGWRLVDGLFVVVGMVVGIAVRLGVGELGNYLLDRLDGWLLFGGSIILGNYLSGSYGVQIKCPGSILQ